MSSIALGLAFSSPLLFLLKRSPAPPVEPGVYFGYNTKRRTSFGLSAVCEYSVVREFDTAPKGKTAVLHLQICISKSRRLGSKKPRFYRGFRGTYLFYVPFMAELERLELSRRGLADLRP